MTIEPDFTKAEFARFEKIQTAVAAIQIPGVTLLVDLFGGIRLYVEYHDVIGTNFRSEKYVVKRGYRDDICLGGVDSPMVLLRRNLRNEIKAIKAIKAN